MYLICFGTRPELIKLIANLYQYILYREAQRAHIFYESTLDKTAIKISISHDLLKVVQNIYQLQVVVEMINKGLINRVEYTSQDLPGLKRTITTINIDTPVGRAALKNVDSHIKDLEERVKLALKSLGKG